MDILSCIGRYNLINWANVEELTYRPGVDDENELIIYFKSGRESLYYINDHSLESLKSFMASQKDLLHYKAHDALKPDRTKIKTDIPE